MNLLDLVKTTPDPISASVGLAKAPFQKRTDQPWLQGTARNSFGAVFGEDANSRVNEKLFHDTEGGYRNADNDPANQRTAMPAVAAPQAQPQQSMLAKPQNSNDSIVSFWQQYLKNKPQQ